MGAGALIRPVALAVIPAYLSNDRDVVLPQMLVRLEELQKFEAATLSAGAEFVELMLMDEREAAVARFYRRGEGESDAWHGQVRAIVGANGGETALADYHDGLQALLAHRPAAVFVNSVELRIDERTQPCSRRLTRSSHHDSGRDTSRPPALRRVIGTGGRSVGGV